MSYQTIFFDLDGTLIDPKDSITKSVQYALSKFGIKAELNEIISFIGPPLEESFQQYYGFNEEQSALGSTYYREHFSKNGIQETMLYEGAKELLQKLKAQNKSLSVVTAKMITYAPALVKKHNIHTYFDNIIGVKPNQSNVSKSTLIKEALALYPELSKDTIVMIGDRKHDIFGAQANDIDSIGVLYGYGSEEELRQSNPTHLVKTIEELGKYL